MASEFLDTKGFLLFPAGYGLQVFHVTSQDVSGELHYEAKMTSCHLRL